MTTALLSVVFIYGLFYGRLPLPVNISLSVSLAAFLYINNRHKHMDFISIDVVAQFSKLRFVNATLKIATLFILTILGVVSRQPLTGAYLMLVMLVLAVFVGGMKLHEYVQILALPLSFLLVGGLALLFELQAEPTGLINVYAFGVWLTVSAEAQANTLLVVSRALGALSCLLLIGMSTPMSDIINTLRRMHLPELIIDLMYLIYRYIFILLALHHEMFDAAKSRLGMSDYRSSLRTTSYIYANLLARSHQLASTNYDAMESRCFDSGIRFLVQKRSISWVQRCLSLGLIATTGMLALIPI
ncbi:MAG: cobalt ECF transporter T component CbiQ [Coriobacteriia bacterium]|nr:cobalt ECF transporter T component CbiQ [Coriobacteriia bacterium]